MINITNQMTCKSFWVHEYLFIGTKYVINLVSTDIQFHNLLHINMCRRYFYHASFICHWWQKNYSNMKSNNRQKKSVIIMDCFVILRTSSGSLMNIIMRLKSERVDKMQHLCLRRKLLYLHFSPSMFLLKPKNEKIK